MKNNHVDTILEQWARERPDLDAGPMAITGRITRVSAFFRNEMQKTFDLYSLNHASFDLLATLLRSGSPYSLSPNDLAVSAMVTSGTITNRIDRLEDASLVNRTQSNEDKRSYMISLTDEGYSIISQAIKAHVETLKRLVGGISAEELNTLSSLLQKVASPFEED